MVNFFSIAIIVFFASATQAETFINNTNQQVLDLSDPVRDYGPWKNLEEDREYIQTADRTSWWLSARACADQGYRLPTWEELAFDYTYLKGTTPVLKNYRRDISRGDIPFFWTSEEDGRLHAFKFSELDLSRGRNPNSVTKDTRYAVLCVR